MLKKLVISVSTAITLMSSLAYSDDSLILAKKLIASQMNVATNSINPDKSLSEIGAGGDQLDAIELIMSIEDATKKEISDSHIEQVMGKLDESAADRITANRLAEIISGL